MLVPLAAIIGPGAMAGLFNTAQHRRNDEMMAADQRLDDLVGKMNAAPGTWKVDATAAVVNEMAA